MNAVLCGVYLATAIATVGFGAVVLADVPRNIRILRGQLRMGDNWKTMALSLGYDVAILTVMLISASACTMAAQSLWRGVC